ncbi:phosphopantetheine-binding protein [Paenibacillus sp. GCM10027628]|uniref:phosphopantetheine-binding protein n=1 Tax=Paenibacillus sp. GCM10027628 TaxID=3273413 RepID=UPI003624FF18
MIKEDQKEEVYRFLRTRIAELAENDQFIQQTDIHDQIMEMGIDSVKMINLIVQIEKQYEIMFDDEEMVLENFATIHLFANSILGKLGIRA